MKKTPAKRIEFKVGGKKSQWSFSHFSQLFSKYTNCSYLLWGGLEKREVCVWDVSFSMSLTYFVGSFVVVAVVIWYLIVIVCGMFIWQYGEHKKKNYYIQKSSMKTARSIHMSFIWNWAEYSMIKKYWVKNWRKWEETNLQK